MSGSRSPRMGLGFFHARIFSNGFSAPRTAQICCGNFFSAGFHRDLLWNPVFVPEHFEFALPCTLQLIFSNFSHFSSLNTTGDPTLLFHCPNLVRIFSCTVLRWTLFDWHQNRVCVLGLTSCGRGAISIISHLAGVPSTLHQSSW